MAARPLMLGPGALLPRAAPKPVPLVDGFITSLPFTATAADQGRTLALASDLTYDGGGHAITVPSTVTDLTIDLQGNTLTYGQTTYSGLLDNQGTGKSITMQNGRLVKPGTAYTGNSNFRDVLGADSQNIFFSELDIDWVGNGPTDQSISFANGTCWFDDCILIASGTNQRGSFLGASSVDCRITNCTWDIGALRAVGSDANRPNTYARFFEMVRNFDFWNNHVIVRPECAQINFFSGFDVNGIAGSRLRENVIEFYAATEYTNTPGGNTEVAGTYRFFNVDGGTQHDIRDNIIFWSPQQQLAGVGGTFAAFRQADTNSPPPAGDSLLRNNTMFFKHRVTGQKASGAAQQRFLAQSLESVGLSIESNYIEGRGQFARLSSVGAGNKYFNNWSRTEGPAAPFQGSSGTAANPVIADNNNFEYWEYGSAPELTNSLTSTSADIWLSGKNNTHRTASGSARFELDTTSRTPNGTNNGWRAAGSKIVSAGSFRARITVDPDDHRKIPRTWGHFFSLKEPLQDANPGTAVNIAKWMGTNLGTAQQTINAFNGVQMRYTWNRLNPTGSTFDFSEPLAHLNAIQAQNDLYGTSKGAMIMVQFKTFRPETQVNGGNPLPADLRDGSTTYAVLNDNQASPGGYAAFIWDPVVKARFIACLTAAAAAFGSHPAFRGWIVQESALGISTNATGDPNNTFGYTPQAHGQAVIDICQAMSDLTPRATVWNFINYFDAENYPGVTSGDIFETVCRATQRMGNVTIGGPDILQRPNGPLDRLVYPYYQLFLSHIKMIAAQFDTYEDPNNNPTVNNGWYPLISIGDGLGPRRGQWNFAKDELLASCVVWNDAENATAGRNTIFTAIPTPINSNPDWVVEYNP